MSKRCMHGCMHGCRAGSAAITAHALLLCLLSAYGPTDLSAAPELGRGRDELRSSRAPGDVAVASRTSSEGRRAGNGRWACSHRHGGRGGACTAEARFSQAAVRRVAEREAADALRALRVHDGGHCARVDVADVDCRDGGAEWAERLVRAKPSCGGVNAHAQHAGTTRRVYCQADTAHARSA